MILTLHTSDASEANTAPEMPPAPEGGWSRRAKAVWVSVWAAPKPPEFVPELDGWLVEKLVHLEHEAETADGLTAQIKASAEARMLYKELMITPGERRRAKIEMRRPDQQRATGTTGGARRRRDPRAGA